MKQRIITVPKNKIVEEALNYNEATKTQLIELYLSDEEFKLLYKNGFFKLINQTASVNVDDYEDDCLIGEEKIKDVIKVIKLKKNFFDSSSLGNLIAEIISLFEEALNRDVGVYFYF